MTWKYPIIIIIIISQHVVGRVYYKQFKFTLRTCN